MTTVALLAPGPSLTKEAAEKVRHLIVGAVTSAFPLAPWAQFLAANDGAFWRKFDGATKFQGRKFTANIIDGTERVTGPLCTSSTSSGVIALEVARTRYRATRVLLLGFDNHGTHYFGAYRNGLSNTPPDRRLQHAQQFLRWGKSHPEVEVINVTSGSHLDCFPRKELDECL